MPLSVQKLKLLVLRSWTLQNMLRIQEDELSYEILRFGVDDSHFNKFSILNRRTYPQHEHTASSSSKGIGSVGPLYFSLSSPYSFPVSQGAWSHTGQVIPVSSRSRLSFFPASTMSIRWLSLSYGCHWDYCEASRICRVIEHWIHGEFYSRQVQ